MVRSETRFPPQNWKDGRAGGKYEDVSSTAVSVIIPCHNAAEFLGDALQSVRDQTLADFECIIVDDSSTDGSRLIAQQFVEADSRFKLVISTEGHGASVSRNVGMVEAKGQWLALLDADDLFLPRRLELLTEIGLSEGADLVFDDQLITEYPSANSTHYAFGFTRRTRDFSQEDFFAGARLFRRSFPTGYMKPLIRRAFLNRTGATYDPTVPSGEDFLFYAQLFADRPRCIATSFPGYVYRRRHGSLSRSEEHLHYHAKLGDRILEEFAAQLSPASRSALAARRRDFEAVADAMPTLIALRRRNWRDLALTLMKRPSIAGTCLRLLQTRATRSWSALRGAARQRSAKNSLLR